MVEKEGIDPPDTYAHIPGEDAKNMREKVLKLEI